MPPARRVSPNLMKRGLENPMRTMLTASVAAAVLATAASADITVTLTNTAFAGFAFNQIVGSLNGRCTGTLTAVQVNVTLNASTAFTYADDICVYVDPEPLSTGGLVQAGGFSNLGAAQRYFWPNGGASAPGTTCIGTITLATPVTFGATAADPAIWVGNGYGAAGTSGTWTGTVTLVGVDPAAEPPYDPCNPCCTLAYGANGNLPFNYETAADRAMGSCGTAYKANFYPFTAPFTGNYTFSTCELQTATNLAGTKLGVLTGCDAGATVVACNDDGCGLDGRASTLSVALTGGTTYQVVVGLDSATEADPGLIRIDVDGPSACSQGAALAFGANTFANTSALPNYVVTTDAAATVTTTIAFAQWYRFVPAVTGAYSFDVCGSVNDTKMAIGTACPATAGSPFVSLAYNDDACACSSGCGTTTQADWSSRLDAANSGIPLTGNLTAGATYYIVLGSFGTGSGAASGTLTINGPTPPPVCPADLNNDGQVNGADLGLLLGNWGPCAGTPCLGDLNLDGVVNGADLGLLLGAWGPCA